MDTVTLRERVLSEMDLSREYEDEEVLELIDKVIVAYGRESYLSLSAREVIRREIFHTIRKLDVLQELVDDPDVTEIMVNGTACIFVERDGKITKWERNFASRQKLEDVVQQIVAKSNRMAVSYTHLDVYKRQVRYIRKNGAAGGTLGTAGVGKQKGSEAAGR